MIDSASENAQAGNVEEKDDVVGQRRPVAVPKGLEDEPRAAHIHARTVLAVAAVCLIYFAQVFALVGAGAQGQIIAAHLGRPEDTSWLTDPIAIFTVVLGPIVSQAADYWGRKPFLVGLTLLGAAGCAVVSRAASMPAAVAGLCVVDAAFGAQPLLHTVSSEVLPRRHRPWAQAADMASNALGLVAGLLVGGHLNRRGDPDGFRTFFYAATAMFAASAVVCQLTYRPLPSRLQRELSLPEKLGRLDWVGYALLAGSLVLFCVGLSYSQNPYEWSHPLVSATFSVGVALGAVLAVYETRFRTDGMFHHGLFAGRGSVTPAAAAAVAAAASDGTARRRRDFNFLIAVVCVFCEGIAFFAATVYFSFEVSALYEPDFLLASVRFSVAFVATMVSSVVTGLYCSHTKRSRWVVVFAFLVFVAFFAGMASAGPRSSNAVWGLAVLMGWALGMTLVALVTVAQLSVPPELVSLASGLVISVRSLGGTVGIAIYNAVFASEMRRLPGRVAEAASAAGLPPASVPAFPGALLPSPNSTAIALVPDLTPEIAGAGSAAVVETHVLAFRNVWVSAVGFVAVAAVAAVFPVDLRGEFNYHIDAPVEEESELYSS